MLLPGSNDGVVGTEVGRGSLLRHISGVGPRLGTVWVSISVSVAARSERCAELHQPIFGCGSNGSDAYLRAHVMEGVAMREALRAHEQQQAEREREERGQVAAQDLSRRANGTDVSDGDTQAGAGGMEEEGRRERARSNSGSGRQGRRQGRTHH